MKWGGRGFTEVLAAAGAGAAKMVQNQAGDGPALDGLPLNTMATANPSALGRVWAALLGVEGGSPQEIWGLFKWPLVG